MKLAAITGLQAEARIARRAGLIAVATGGDAARTAAAAARLLEQGATHLVSFGIAGGLDPTLVPGALLPPRLVHGDAGAAFPVDAAWRQRVLGLLHNSRFAIVDGEICGVDRPVASAAEKAELFRRTAAAAADLESHIVASIAARAGARFIALRAVADHALRDLPAAAMIPLDEAGRPRLRAVLSCIARAPASIPAVLSVARDARRALETLRGAAYALAASV